MDNENKEIFVNYLKEMFPNPKCELQFNSNFQLLVAVILSAQCTDKRVNMVTKEMFKKYPNCQDYANMEIETLERIIKPCGFYHNKAKSIIETSKTLLEKYNGEVPQDFDELQSLRGVGRKTANVMHSVAFNKDAIAVDTHVFRVSNRVGLVNTKTPLECEKALMQEFDKSMWSELHYLLVLFGRYHCKAIKPNCENCAIKNICKYYSEVKNVCR